MRREKAIVASEMDTIIWISGYIQKARRLGCCPGFLFAADRNARIDAYSFVALKMAAKPNLDSRPPYAVDLSRCNTTTYGGAFVPRNSFTILRPANIPTRYSLFPAFKNLSGSPVP